MSRYKIKIKGEETETEAHSELGSEYDSDYESDGETKYHPTKTIGSGGYAVARLFKSVSDKKVVVLNPVAIPGDIEEAEIKLRFFKTVYPHQPANLFKFNQDYRLVVPYIEYMSYDNLIIDNNKFQIQLFLSAAHALQDCHNKGMIVIDLKEENIYYDASTQKSYLIDGGLSAPIGTEVDPLAFQIETIELLEESMTGSIQIPPECWSIKPDVVLASPKMDIYALGVLMRDILVVPDANVQSLVDRCLELDPERRPTLIDIITDLDSMLESMEMCISSGASCKK